MSRRTVLVAKWVGAFLLSFCSFSFSNAQIVPGTPNVVTHTMGDDGYVSVPLQFGFPFYGKLFTHSFMFDNGVVGLYDPVGNNGCNPQNNYCGGQQWSAVNPNVNMGPQFNYMIAPLWADIAPNPNTKYYTEGTGQYQRYVWENIHEYYSGGSRLNTFGLELKPSGSISSYYSLVNINSSNTFIGTIGNSSLGEWNTIGFHPYGTVLNQIPNWTIDSTGANLCATDPLSSPSCPGYTEAYFNQQCSISPLYNSNCPGYAQAYFNQQCTANPLYNVNCPGYASAYLAYQCSINPLYSTSCDGYEQAYFDQQCKLDGLYNRNCPNYAEAYAAKEALTPKQETTTVAQVTETAVAEVTSKPTTSASPAQVTTVVPLAPQPQPQAVVVADSTPAAKPVEQPQQTDKDKPKTARQELTERRQAAARAKAVEEGKNLASEVSKSTSMEKQVEVQNVVIQAMGYIPGFDAYGKAFVPDGSMYRPFTVYNNQTNIDNRAGGVRLFGGSDKSHREMVDAQYQLGK